MTRIMVIIAGLLVLSSPLLADDLYNIKVSTPRAAQRLAATGAEPLVRLDDGYLVLLGPDAAATLAESGLEATLVASGVTKDQLAVDNRLDRANVSRFPLVFEQGGVRLYRADRALVARQADGQVPDLRSLDNTGLKIEYIEPRIRTEEILARLSQLSAPLDSLIGLISQDSLTSYLLTLQAFGARVAGTTPNITSRNWLYNKFVSFGYDSVNYDTFSASVSGGTKPCYNILVTKVGTVHPNHFVIIGAHRDAVTGSPGADDNGSGTVAVLEMARILKDIPTDMTVIFALYDAEEYGLFGSYHHASDVAARGDSLVYMLNMDMIAHFENSTQANLFHGADTEFSSLWITLADSLTGITGHLAGSSGGSDHYPFTQRGYPATFAAEYIFSTVYHSFRDSSSYMNFEYMTRMVQACLATAYTVDQTAGPTATLVFVLQGNPPELVDPFGSTELLVDLIPVYGGVIVPGSERLHYSIGGGAFAETPLALVSNNTYTAQLPAITCASDVRYYFSADELTKGTFTYPDISHPFSAFGATGTLAVFEDYCDTDKGWTVTGNALDGQWNRGYPAGNGERGDPPTDFEGSGQCWLTDNVYGNSDVDNGYTYLTSPVINLSAGDAQVQYALWYSNSFGSAPYEDIFRVWVSNDNGSTWQLADEIGPETDADGGWYLRSFWVGNYVTPTGQVRLRFEASDGASGSVVEAAIDNIQVRRFECTPPSCCIDTRGNVNGSVAEVPDLSDLSVLIAYLTMTPRPELPCPDEANINASAVETPDLSDLSLLIAYLTQSPRPTLPNCP